MTSLTSNVMECTQIIMGLAETNGPQVSKGNKSHLALGKTFIPFEEEVLLSSSRCVRVKYNSWKQRWILKCASWAVMKFYFLPLKRTTSPLELSGLKHTTEKQASRNRGFSILKDSLVQIICSMFFVLHVSSREGITMISKMNVKR